MIVPDTLFDRFKAKFEALKGHVHLVASWQEAVEKAGAISREAKAQRVAVEPRAGTTYIVLDYVESAPSTGNGDQREVRGRLVEDFRLRASSEPPAAPALELARVQLDGTPQPAIGKAILDFLRGKDVHGVKVVLPRLKVVPIKGTDTSVTHPAVARR